MPWQSRSLCPVPAQDKLRIRTRASCKRSNAGSAPPALFEKLAKRSQKESAEGLEQARYVQMLRVRKHATPSVSRTARPGVHDFGQEFEDSLLPRMADEDIAIQALWVSH